MGGRKLKMFRSFSGRSLNYMFFQISVILLLAGLSAGCCYVRQEQQPARPNAISSWRERTDFGVTRIGYFVLNKGESLDNGKLGVRIIDIRPAECKCLTCIPTNPIARIGFYQPPNNTLVCDGEFQGSASLQDVAKCDPSIGATGIYVYAINSKEQWVAFDLRK